MKRILALVGFVCLLSPVMSWGQTSFSSNYRGLSFFGGSDCNRRQKITGKIPAGQGPFPVFVWTTGTLGDYRGSEAEFFIDQMVARGYIAASVEYSNVNANQTCDDYVNRAACIYDDTSNAQSAVNAICSMSEANCDPAQGGGVVTAGLSQGGMIAALARNFSTNVEATYAIGIGSYNYNTDTPLDACMVSGRMLPADRLVVVNGVQDEYFGSQESLDALFGTACGTGTTHCLDPQNGWGWYVVSDCEVSDGAADHCYHHAGGGCSGDPVFEEAWAPPSTYDWSLKPNLDWLASKGTHRNLSNSNACAPSNQPPTPELTFDCTDLTCSFDGSGSSDPDGVVVSYDWDFGDGATASGPTTSHTFAAADVYTVTLTVEDDQGLSAGASQPVSVSSSGGNNPPTAVISLVTCTELACDFDGAGSSDPDGSLVSHQWDFGDGQQGSGETTSHVYAAAGDYNVTLTVEDDEGATDSDTAVAEATSGGGSDPTSLSVADLDGTSTSNKNVWTAGVTAEIRDDLGGAVAGAVVIGAWGTGDAGSCTTGADGVCSIALGMDLPKKEGQVSFSVTSVSGPLPYAAGSNSDPDGDSDGTTIVVSKP